MRIFRSCFYFFSLYSRAVFQGDFTNKKKEIGTNWSYILSEWLLPGFLKLHGETLCCFRFSKNLVG